MKNTCGTCQFFHLFVGCLDRLKMFAHLKVKIDILYSKKLAPQPRSCYVHKGHPFLVSQLSKMSCQGSDPADWVSMLRGSNYSSKGHCTVEASRENRQKVWISKLTVDALNKSTLTSISCLDASTYWTKISNTFCTCYFLSYIICILITTYTYRHISIRRQGKYLMPWCTKRVVAFACREIKTLHL